ncbi:MAG: DNA topoisomerase 3 [Prevotella histicola]|uniref:DNA topoisomerase n=1 Tax=Prevotella histicola JCM 15637 = DNF00424 TaxID=1236504 RepID=A0AAW3FBF2_9BACT|nr:DNA topoisomerase 3 [Prevotella histicola]KGF24443.1 DNA topoisomerase III [Prevotella histicola JCM 15637 = DNF00424]MBF1394048.1 DNA topoisomerase 3 [Prevotella histicola]MBF1401709.1 DNA topoisomerase 3 [Prevotella histicola]
MKVCIAEKPSVARDIARILGANKSCDGYMEGNGYQVTWTFGHLCELKEPNDYSENWKHWSLAALPMIPPRFGIKLIEDEGIKKQFAVIERLYHAADEIINCGDAGQEGELIQRWVMQKAGVKCPVKRLWISSMTDEAIREGFASLKEQDVYQPLYLAGLSRAIGDWLLGMNATRLYTLKYGNNNYGKGQVLSIGRVQTPTLALIVQRQKEINNFKPEPYWVLATVYRDTQFTATKGKFTSKEEGEKAFSTIEGKPFTITNVTKKKGTEQPKQLYDLTSLQVDCNRKYGYSAEMTLNTIQSLYEKKLTTYPRVDTQYLPDDVYPKCPQTMNGLFQTAFAGKRPYAELVKALGGKPLPKSKRVFDGSKVTDHHAIIPTGIPPQGLTDAEKNVYDLIARRFIAAFYPDCKFSTTTVIGEVDGIEFKVTGKEILDQGWRVVFATPNAAKEKGITEEQAAGNGDASAKDSSAVEPVSEVTLPSFTKGETGPHTPTLTEKQTTPPKHYTEASLLRAMETAGKLVDDDTLRAALKENGIGRPSSRAGIIETLFKRHYICRKRKNLEATETGIALIDTIREKLLISAELTGIWEKKLRDIEHKKYDAGQFINELKEQINNIVNDVLADNSNRKIGQGDVNKK